MEAKDIPGKSEINRVLEMMEKNLGAEPRPMKAMAELLPEVVLKQAQDRKFLFEMTGIPPRYKHLICIAVASAVSSHLCTETFIKLAARSGVTKEEIAEAIATANFALGSTVYASAIVEMEHLLQGGTGDDGA